MSINKLILASLFILCCAFHINAQFSDNFAQGARNLGMGNTGLNQTDIGSLRSNQAGMTGIKQFSVGLHTENRFLVESLYAVGLDFAYPTSFGIFGITINSFGNESYKEQKLGIAYARKLFKNLSIGGQFDVLNHHIEQYGNQYNYTFEIGVYSIIFPKLHGSAHIFSPGDISLTELDPIPSRIRFGLDYLVSDKFTIAGEFDKNLEDEYNLKFGAEYKIIPSLWLRAGTTTRDGTYSFGLSYLYKKIGIDFGFVQHNVLGSSPALSIRYGSQLKNNKQ